MNLRRRLWFLLRGLVRSYRVGLLTAFPRKINPTMDPVEDVKFLYRTIERLEAQRCDKCGDWGVQGEDDADWGGCYTWFRCGTCHHSWKVGGFTGPRFGVF